MAGFWDSLFDGSDNSVIGQILGTPQQWQNNPVRSTVQGAGPQLQGTANNAISTGTAALDNAMNAQPYGLITGGGGTTVNGQFSPNAAPPAAPPMSSAALAPPPTQGALPDSAASLTGPPVTPPGPPLDINPQNSTNPPIAASAPPGPPLNIAPSPSTNAVADASGNIVPAWRAGEVSPPMQPGAPLNIVPPGGAFNPSAAGAPNNLAPPGPQQTASIMPNALPATPIAAPPAAAMTGAPNLTTLGNGNWQMALGLTRPPYPFENAVVSGMAGLGRGLSAVGAMRPGASGAQAFAAGAGGSIEGAVGMQQQQEHEQFTRASQQFHNMIERANAKDVHGYRTAQAAYLQARAKLMDQSGAGPGRGGKFDNPYSRVAYVDSLMLNTEKAQQAQREKEWKTRQASGDFVSNDEMQARIKQDNDALEQRRNEEYARMGVNPNQAQKFRTMGLSRDNPFPTENMTKEEFEANVPQGAYFDSGHKFDQSGKAVVNGQALDAKDFGAKPGDPIILRRKWETQTPFQQLPPLPNAQPQQGGGGTIQAEPSVYDDMLAMQPAA
jgi:hypothetical protein